MLFEELDIKFEYDSRRNNVYNDFFNKILPQSVIYRRFGGLFSGQKFVQCAEGLQEFIKENDGEMKLAIIPVFSKKDKEALKEKTRDAVITENWIKDLSEIKDKLEKDHVKALAWMIANHKLEIKLILPEHEDGKPLTKEELKEQEFFRQEIGIFFNKENGEPLSFRGIIDLENKKLGQFVRIRTSRQWIESEKEVVDSDFQEFNNFWENETHQIGSITCKIKPLSEKLLEYFRQEAPESKEKIPPLRKLPQLRDYQSDAVENWHDNGDKGIFEMATGTGKTFTAIGCIKKLESIHDKLLVIIAAPYTNLVDQWKEELSKWYIDSRILDKGWTQTIFDEVHTLNTNDKNSLSVLICTHAKFARKEFLKQIEKCKIPTMLIVDEAHHVGAGNTEKDDDGVVTTEGSRKGLSAKYQFRLALSATIERYFDDDGTDFLRNYFTGTKGKSTVFDYDLKKAIDEDKLCKYNYYPFFVELTEDEFVEYKRITYEAVRKLKSKILEIRIQGEDLMKKRALIIRDAEQKMSVFKEIMKKFSDIKHLLVFCSEKQYDGVEEILEKPSANFGYNKRIDYRKITYNNPKKKKDRMKILKAFAEEDYHVILSNKVLDEGMDVPEAKSCIVLASTSNPAQFIQRRGRVLRKFDNPYKDGSRKTHADIYDVLVRPRLDGIEDPESIKLEIGMIRSQLRKIQQMSELAINKEYCMEKIGEFTYGLPMEEFESNWNK